MPLLRRALRGADPRRRHAALPPLLQRRSRAPDLADSTNSKNRLADDAARDAPEAYEKFQKKEDGTVKVLFQP